jgi:hypothetical protein
MDCDVFMLTLNKADVWQTLTVTPAVNELLASGRAGEIAYSFHFHAAGLPYPAYLALPLRGGARHEEVFMRCSS